MARKTKEDAEKTYHALLEAAAELFSCQGFASTTLHEIAKRAGVTRGAFYWHFEDKSEALMAIWNTHALPVFNPVKEQIADLPRSNPASGFREQTNRLLEKFISDPRVGRAMFIIMHNMEFSEKDSSLIAFLHEQNAMFQNVMIAAFSRIAEEGQLKSGIDARSAALGFICLFVGMINKALLPISDLDLENDGRAILNNYLDSVLTV